MHTLTVSPNFSFQKKNNHTIGLNFNFVQNKNLNKLNHNAADVQTITAGVNYGIDLEEIRLGITTGYDFSISSSQYAHYNSHGINAGLNYRIMQKDNLNWNLNYNGYVAYNIQKDEGASNDFSVSNSIGSNLSFKKAHSASLYLSLSNFSDLERIGQRVQTDLDVRFTLSYSYAFSVRVIKKKTKEQRAEDKIKREAKKISKH